MSNANTEIPTPSGVVVLIKSYSLVVNISVLALSSPRSGRLLMVNSVMLGYVSNAVRLFQRYPSLPFCTFDGSPLT